MLMIMPKTDEEQSVSTYKGEKINYTLHFKSLNITNRLKSNYEELCPNNMFM